jgi:hypothetical protein
VIVFYNRWGYNEKQETAFLERSLWKGGEEF